MKFKGLFFVALSALVIGIAGCSKETATDASASPGAGAAAPPMVKEGAAAPVTGNEPLGAMPAPPGVATGTPGG
jgi:PBP1b-binding outer membrane lipoprotein LpoB